ncbi:ATP-binding cassette domain-containing protein [Roseovarius pelagicus]|uniref:ATP-binding cassette domain-containing protein n=1 Tax=Roseovarius pelagicus TaxID=2980108 RepID=UPI0035711A3E
MTNADAYISIDNVSKFFGSFQAIENISMDIGQGEFFSLLGASGCGKTTLLRMLAGFRIDHQGRDLHRRTANVGRAAASSAGEHGFPELRDLSALKCRGQHRLRIA